MVGIRDLPRQGVGAEEDETRAGSFASRCKARPLLIRTRLADRSTGQVSLASVGGLGNAEGPGHQIRIAERSDRYEHSSRNVDLHRTGQRRGL